MISKEDELYGEKLKSYSLYDLYDVRSRVNVIDYPNRYELIIKEIEKREKGNNNNEIEKENNDIGFHCGINDKHFFTINPIVKYVFLSILVVLGLVVSIVSFYYWADYGFPNKWESPNSILSFFSLCGLGATTFGIIGFWAIWQEKNGKKL